MTERALLLVLPGSDGESLPGRDEIVGLLRERNFAIVGEKSRTLSAEEAHSFYAEHDGTAQYAPLVAAIRAGPVAAFALELPNAVAALSELVAANPMNGLHVAPPADVARELKFFFPEGAREVAQGDRRRAGGGAGLGRWGAPAALERAPESLALHFSFSASSQLRPAPARRD
jgi:nucleoside diphosphate kinase